MTGWWDGLTDEGRLIAIGGVDADVPDGPNGDLINLRVSIANRATAAYNSLMSGMTTEGVEEEAPALPLAGIGILGLLLAGRGAWLRRRT